MSNPKSPTSPEAQQTAADIGNQVKRTAGKAAQAATDTAKSQAEAIKSSVVDEMSGVASALRHAADDLRNGSPQERTFGQIADGLADASEALRHKDLGAMVQDVSTFARRNPIAFLGAAALIGFAATRFVKASTQPQSTGASHPPDQTATAYGDVS
ncbi:hypothetical protein V8J82_22165 [Gymnodinialimonas sp. 2305UL16-5]|uniref:hypothetical protein n=1 Tax=Gymnodinialimonas mytili TaxID=3126503 RepID=UPI0030B6FBB0